MEWKMTEDIVIRTRREKAGARMFMSTFLVSIETEVGNLRYLFGELSQQGEESYPGEEWRLEGEKSLGEELGSEDSMYSLSIQLVIVIVIVIVIVVIVIISILAIRFFGV
ncbi:Nut Family Member 2B [Manis pentadactyla]|nr:Nut Family Member 2B [Manis pentadactyla]